MVEIVLDSSISSFYNNTKTKEGISIERIMLNNNNKFRISKGIISSVEKNLSEDNKEKWKAWIINAMDSNKLIPMVTENFEDEIIKEASDKSDFFIGLKFTKKCKSKPEKTIYLDLEDSVHSKIIQLLENGYINIDSSEFENDQEIKDFFKLLLKSIVFQDRHEIHIISRYANFTGDVVDILKSTFRKKVYYTNCKRNSDPSNCVEYVKKQLGNNTRLLATRKSDNIHERKILIKNCILTFDDEIDKISKVYNTWEISFKINSKIASKIKGKLSKFKQVHQECK